MQRIHRCHDPILLIALMLISCIPAHAIKVMLADETVRFSSVQPVMQSDQIFIPVRPVAEALGASLAYDPVTDRLTVLRGSDSAIITIGQDYGIIRGKRIRFAHPPFLRSGSVHVPVLFFSEMFGLAVIWDPFRQILRYEPVFPGMYPPPRVYFPPPGTATTTAVPGTTGPRPPTSQVTPGPYVQRNVEGTVVRTVPSRTAPRIVVRVNNRVVNYAVSQNALVVRGLVGKRATEVPIGEIRPGDRVTLSVDGNGTVQSIRARYREVRGQIQSLGDQTVIVSTGETLVIANDTEIILPEDVSGQLSDLKVGDMIVARVSPDSNQAYLVTVVPSTVGLTPETDGALTLNTTGPLRAGDMLIVTFRSYPGGKATFSIPGLVTDSAMAESPQGVYTGQYRVQEGDVLPSGKVAVRFVDSHDRVYTMTSRRAVAVNTTAATLPRITYPRQGQVVASPIVVQGFANPGDRVMVTIEYRQNMQGIEPIQGVAALQEVTANAQGGFRTAQLPITVPWDENDQDVPLPDDYGPFNNYFEFRRYPIVYTITAAVIGPDGQATSSYTVSVRKAEGRQLNEGAVTP